MQMVKIQMLGERGKMALMQMCRTGRAFCNSGSIYLVPDSALGLLDKLGANFRKLNADGYPEKSMTDEMIKGLERHCGKLVVQKVGQNEAIAMEHLRHPKAKYRFAALDLIDWKWGVTQEVADICEELVVSDPDVSVRGLAAVRLGGYYSRSGNLRVGDLLARIVCKESENPQVRQSAYRALYWLPEEFIWLPPLDFRFPNDVDWEFVDSFVRQNPIKRWYRRVCLLFSRLQFAWKDKMPVSK